MAVTAGSWLYIQRDNRPAGELVVADFATIDTTLTEVELELTGHQKVQVVNKAVIELNDTGAIHVNREEIRPETGNRSEEARGPAMNVLKVPRGRHSSLVLADGTKVWINSGSVLYFPTVFDPDHRTIYAGGEIYLEVAKDASRPFYVKTSEMTVRALGTALNVTAYPDDADQSVVLSEGRVEVAAKNGRKQLMAVNDRLVLKDRRMTVSTVQAYDYTSWKDGIFLFRDQSLAFVALLSDEFYLYAGRCGLFLFRETGLVRGFE